MTCRSPGCEGRQVAGRRFCRSHCEIFDRCRVEINQRSKAARNPTVSPKAPPTCRLHGCDGSTRYGVGSTCWRHRTVADDVSEVVLPTRRKDGQCFWAKDGCPRPARPGRSVCPPCGRSSAYAGACALDECVSAPVGGGYCGKHKRFAD